MDLAQITIAQTKSQNQCAFDMEAYEKAILRRDACLRTAATLWRRAHAPVFQAARAWSAASKMAMHRRAS